MKYILGILICMLFLTGCSTTDINNEKNTNVTQENNFTDFFEGIEKNYCDEPRPEMCTEQYEPVCGSDNETYGNACTACSNEDIEFWVDGKCSKLTENNTIGNQRDEHGCLISGGYTWNESINVCLREWEFEEHEKKAIYIATDYLGNKDNLTVSEVLNADCRGCYTIIFIDESDAEMMVNLDNWYVIEGEKHYCPEERPEMCTKQYDPVCGSDNETYGNACTACSNEDIEYFINGEC